MTRPPHITKSCKESIKYIFDFVIQPDTGAFWYQVISVAALSKRRVTVGANDVAKLIFWRLEFVMNVSVNEH